MTNCSKHDIYVHIVITTKITKLKNNKQFNICFIYLNISLYNVWTLKIYYLDTYTEKDYECNFFP